MRRFTDGLVVEKGNRSVSLTSQYLFHLSSFGQLIDEFVEVPGLSNQRVLNFFDPVSTNHARDQGSVGIEMRFFEKTVQGHLFLDQRFELLLIVSGQPVDDFVKLLLSSAFLFNFRDVVRIDRRERHLGDPLRRSCRRFFHSKSVCG